MYVCIYIGAGSWFLNDSIFLDIIDYDEFLTVRTWNISKQKIFFGSVCMYVCMYVAKAQ